MDRDAFREFLVKLTTGRKAVLSWLGWLVAGFHIPQGSQVIMSPYWQNRDTAQWGTLMIPLRWWGVVGTLTAINKEPILSTALIAPIAST